MADDSQRPACTGSSAPLQLTALLRLLAQRWRLVCGIFAVSISLCLFYCLVAPAQYEARARVAMGQDGASPLHSGPTEALTSASLLSAPLQLETLAQELRSEELAWQVIDTLRLDQESNFRDGFAKRFPDYRHDVPNAAAKEWLLNRFARRLQVHSIPHTLLLEVRFRSRSAELSANVVNTLLRIRDQQQKAEEQKFTGEGVQWLQAQLTEMEGRMNADRQQLIQFENAHAILAHSHSGSDESGDAENARRIELEQLGRQLAIASSERILAEATWRAAASGDPELVALNTSTNSAETDPFPTALLQQIRQRHSNLMEEAAQLNAEHGPNYPRAREIQNQIADLEQQRKAEDARLLQRFRTAMDRAMEQEQKAAQALQDCIAHSLDSNAALREDERLNSRYNASQELYLRLKSRTEEAALLSGMSSSRLTVVDAARTPWRSVWPNLPLLLAITLFLAFWISCAALYLAELLPSLRVPVTAPLILLACSALLCHAQAPTPTTSGLPRGILTPGHSQESANTSGTNNAATNSTPTPPLPGPTMVAAPARLGPGDLIEVQEYHTPELHSVLRIAENGTASLPMLQPVRLDGLSEDQASTAIAEALIQQRVLLHPHVTVLVLASVGQDVSILGEVARPGVYPYAAHHRLLDFISAASGLSPSAGRLVNIFHRNDPNQPHAVVLDPGGTDPGQEHNPELLPGDTVQVSRAGLVYVIGDVVRPGGFPVDPSLGLTVVEALSLAWGPARNAASTHAVLIREQKGGRTMTRLNLKRMLSGQDPDLPIRDRDILFVPDSAAKELLNRSLESAIQSAVGVSIYAGMVYSQRF